MLRRIWVWCTDHELDSVIFGLTLTAVLAAILIGVVTLTTHYSPAPTHKLVCYATA